MSATAPASTKRYCRVCEKEQYTYVASGLRNVTPAGGNGNTKYTQHSAICCGHCNVVIEWTE